jgi:hypothetical protein
MMVAATESEVLFETFLTDNRLPFIRVPVAETARPDFAVGAETPWGPIFFEVKEIAADDNFTKGQFGVSARIVGDHIRSKISESKKQMQFGARPGTPSILLIYNALDTIFHLFGTEDHDFKAAMLGELTLKIGTLSGALLDAGHGRNQSLRENQNTSFSALGHLAPVGGVMTVRLFPNLHAKVPLPTRIPACFQIVAQREV